MTFQGSEQHFDVLAWREAAADDARYELLDGVVHAMGAERVEDARATNAVLRQLEQGIEPAGRVVMHHRRVGDRLEAASHEAGVIRLDPPGLALEVSALFSAG